MGRRLLLVSLVLVLLFVIAPLTPAVGMVGVVGAQGEEPLPPDVTPIALVSELGALLAVLGSYALFGSGAITYLKPILFNPLSERLDPNVYLAVIYTARLFFGAITLWLFGGVATLYQYAPSLQAIELAPQTRDTAVFVGVVMILSLGQEGIYVIVNVLRNLAGMGNVGEPSAAALARASVRERRTA